MGASGRLANAIAFTSGSGTFRWRTPFEWVSIVFDALGSEALEEC
jgi:hypothetical protein